MAKKKEEKKTYKTKEEKKGPSKTKVKVLKNHHIGRIRVKGAEYLLDSGRVPYMVKQGIVEEV